MEEWGAYLVRSKHLASILFVFFFFSFYFNFKISVIYPNNHLLYSSWVWSRAAIWLILGWAGWNTTSFHLGSSLFPLVFILGPWLKGQQLSRACSSHGGLLEHKETSQTIKHGFNLLLMSFPLALHLSKQVTWPSPTKTWQGAILCPRRKALHNHTVKGMDP